MTAPRPNTVGVRVMEGMQNAHGLIDLPAKLTTKWAKGKELKWGSEFSLQVQLRGLGWLLTGRLHGDEALS
jgi:hypothetical protein